jgi:transposase
MYYVGIDLHKRTVWMCVLDSEGRSVHSIRLHAGPDSLKAFFKKVPRPFKVAVEATYNWYYVVDIAEQYAEKVYLANSYELKAFAKRHKKNDKIDARLIAWLLQRGDLPTVMIPDRTTRRVRELIGYRMRLVSDKTRNIVRLKALLDKLGMVAEGNYNTKKNREEVRRLPLRVPYDVIVRGYLERIERLCRELKVVEKVIAERARRDRDTVNLMSLPGLDFFSAVLIKMEIIAIERFYSFPRLCAYSGLAPRVHASGGHCYYGPLNRNRRRYLQWILLENVYHATRKIPRLKRKYLAIKKRKGSNTAKVAVARDYLKLIYHILKEKRPWYPEEEYQGRGYLKSQSAEAPALSGV